MQELVKLFRNDVFTDCLVIAEGTNNQHHAIQQIINRYEGDFKEFGKVAFEMLPMKSGQKVKVFQLNEEQATFLITLLRNSKKVVAFKKELVKQFYEMRRFILERQSREWMETRKTGKLTRKAETDTIQKLVEYAKRQGSTHSDKLYMTYSKLANKMAGIKKRDEASVMQLNNLSLMENVILHIIDTGILTGKYYKEIYQDCKNRLRTKRH